jgi:hypothetical protein
MLQRIYERTMKVWYRENPSGSAKTFREESIENELAALESFLEHLYEDNDLVNQNTKLSEWIKIYAKEIYDCERNKAYYVNELIYSGLNSKKLTTFVKWLHEKSTSKLEGSILYEIVGLIEDRVDWLKERYEAIKLERHQRLVFKQRDYAKIQYNKAIKERYSLLKNPPCKVYKENHETGEKVYKRTDFTSFYFGNSKIYTVNAYINIPNITEGPETVNGTNANKSYDVFSVNIQTGEKTIHSPEKYEKLYGKGV